MKGFSYKALLPEQLFVACLFLLLEAGSGERGRQVLGEASKDTLKAFCRFIKALKGI